MLPSSTELIYFVETAQALNISRASERLGISQPSLTLAIKRLEDALGASLFHRNKRGVSLTKAGSQLLVHARTLLQTWEQVQSSALASVEEVQGTYTIGCHPSVALCTLSTFLPELMAKHPQLNIKLRHDLSRKITENVISSEIDLAIVVNPVKHPDLIIQKLYDDEVTLWKTDKGNFPTQDTKSDLAVLVCDPELAQSQSLIKQLKKSGIEFNRYIPSGNLEVVTHLTAHGAGIGLIPTRVAQLSVRKLKPIPGAPVYHDEICLLYRVENKKVKTIQAIAEAVRKKLSGPSN